MSFEKKSTKIKSDITFSKNNYYFWKFFAYENPRFQLSYTKFAEILSNMIRNVVLKL